MYSVYVDALCFSLALVTRSWDGLCRVVCCWLSLYDTLPVVFVVRPLGALFLGDVGCIDSCIFFLSRARSACEDIIRISYFWLWFSLCRVFLLSGDVFFVRFLCCLGDLSHFVVFFIEFVKNRYNLEGRIVAVCGMLADKEVKLSLAQVSPMISEWFVANVNNERGASAAEIRQEIIKLSERPVHCFNFVEHAYENAKTSLTEHDCLLVFGSFHIAGDILAYIDKASA